MLLIGAMLRVSAVGLFEAPFRLAGMLGFVGLPVAQRGRAAAGPERGWPDRDSFERALRYLLLFQGVVVAPMVVWAEPLTRIVLGRGLPGVGGHAARPGALRAALGISPLLAGAVNYLGAARRRIPIAIAAVVVNTAIDVALLGGVGHRRRRPSARTSPTRSTSLAHLASAGELVQLRLRPLAAAWPARSAAAGAHGGGAVRLRHRGEWRSGSCSSAGRWASAVYMAALLLTRQVSRAELAGLWRRLAASARAVSPARLIASSAGPKR